MVWMKRMKTSIISDDITWFDISNQLELYKESDEFLGITNNNYRIDTIDRLQIFSLFH